MEYTSAEHYRISRRQTLQQVGAGFGGLVLADILRADDAEPRRIHNLLPQVPPRLPQARAVIQLFMHGGPSQVDLLDPKPQLNRYDGSMPPAEVRDDEERTKYLLGTPFKFHKSGESGVEFSDRLPHIARHADRIAVIRSMFTEHRNHEHAIWMAQTGLIVPGRPTLGAWAAYGLGTVNQNLPAYVALPDPQGQSVDGIRNWSSGWLPPIYQGTAFRSHGTPVLNLKPRQEKPASVEAGKLNLLRTLNAGHKQRHSRELELDARITNLELAARMQLAAVDTLDVEQESEATQKLYGLDNPTTAGYGRRLLMARRMIESGVRFIQVFAERGNPWDSHTDVDGEIRRISGVTDFSVSALLTDLKQRGLLDETIVVWTGEFGRLPVSQNGKGRDHNRNAFTLLLAGGGFKPGYIYGTTDDVGYKAVEGRVSVPDMFATVMHQLGIDHDALTYEHHGRPETPTDSVVTDARVVRELLA